MYKMYKQEMCEGRLYNEDATPQIHRADSLGEFFIFNEGSFEWMSRK